jgi:succinylglutamate desuccinylase
VSALSEPPNGPPSVRTQLVGPREAARLRSDQPGPTLIAVGGIHGNEPSGIEAALRVVGRLARGDVKLQGELLVLRGNMSGLAGKRRYLERDLNRVWTEAQIASLEARGDEKMIDEDREAKEILVAIRRAIGRARGQVYLVDLHTTSAAGVPFVIFGDTLPQRHFCRDLPLPVVMGLEEQIDGALASYWTRQGCITFTVEGGQHDDPGSIDNLEATLLLAAESAGLFARGAVAEIKDAHALLESRRGHLPRVMEVVERHAITPEEGFKMTPGFKNLDVARGGQLLATDRGGEIRAPKDGLVILPLYQGQGNDGFFWGRAVSEARLRVSERLRHMQLDRFLPLLPGVARDEREPSRLVVNTHIAKLLPLDVFHMFGYRRIRKGEDSLTVERQPG